MQHLYFLITFIILGLLVYDRWHNPVTPPLTPPSQVSQLAFESPSVIPPPSLTSTPTVVPASSQTVKPEALHILFDKARCTLSTEAKAALRLLVDRVLARKHEVRRIRLIGYTDNQGKEGFNRYLASRRAAVVQDFLDQEGIVRRLLHAEVGGEGGADNATAQGRAQNRRTTVIVEFE